MTIKMYSSPAAFKQASEQRLRDALDQTFTFRKTHALPKHLPDPLPAWTKPYLAMARRDKLAWTTIEEVTKAAKAFLNPVLDGNVDSRWAPETWSWH